MARRSIVEQVLVEAVEGDEARKVTLIEGDSLVVTEVTEGSVTEAAYGTRRHAHKMLGDAGAFARALGSEADAVSVALDAFFAVREDDGEAALLSDLMDCLDQAGESYTYVAWNAEGDAVRRA